MGCKVALSQCKLEVQNVIPSRKDAVQFKVPFGRAPAGSGSCTVARCRPLGGRQVPRGARAGAAEPEKRVSPAPVVSVREERRREKNGSGEQ